MGSRGSSCELQTQVHTRQTAGLAHVCVAKATHWTHASGSLCGGREQNGSGGEGRENDKTTRAGPALSHVARAPRAQQRACSFLQLRSEE